jgi:hypothetical protein
MRYPPHHVVGNYQSWVSAGIIVSLRDQSARHSGYYSVYQVVHVALAVRPTIDHDVTRMDGR